MKKILLIVGMCILLIISGCAKTTPVITTPNSNALECTRTTGTIDTNIIGIGQPAGLVMKDLPYLQELGVKWVRTDFYWPDVETSNSVYHWTDIDNTVRVLNQNNINLLLQFNYVPQWVWDLKREDRMEAVYIFTKALAARNLGKVRYYEIFNEPNLPGIGFFREKDKVDVSTYLDFLAASNRGIHEADPNAVIVLGGLSPDGMNPATFMKQLYELGGKDCFDVLAYHPYDSFGTIGNFKDKANNIRTFTALYGDSNKTIWFNELGTTEESVRIDYLNQMKGELPVVPAWFWFSLHDFSKEDRFGILTEDYQKKPAYDIFRKIVVESKK